MTLGALPDFTVVRLTDGRTGMKGRWAKRGKGLVQFADGTGVELDKTEPVTVVRFPAQLAGDYLTSLEKSSNDDPERTYKRGEDV